MHIRKNAATIRFKFFPNKFKKGRKGEIESKNLIQLNQLVNIDEKKTTTEAVQMKIPKILSIKLAKTLYKNTSFKLQKNGARLCFDKQEALP